MTHPMADSSQRARRLRWLGTLLAIVLLIYLLTQQGWEEILSAIQKIPLWGLFLAQVMIGVSRLAVTGRWYVLLRTTITGISWSHALRLTFAGLFASNFLPTTIGGDVIRLAGARQLKLDGAVCAASLVVDRLVGMGGMAMAVPLGLIPILDWLAADRTFIPNTSEYIALGVSGRKLLREGFDLIRRVLQSLSLWLKRPDALAGSFFLTGVHMVCLFGAITMLLDAMGDPLSLWMVAGLWSFVYFITLLPVSINGYGVQEVSMTLIFTRIGGISLQSGLTIAILVRTLLLVASLPGVAFMPGILADAGSNAVKKSSGG